MPYVPRVYEYVLTLGIRNSIINRWNRHRPDSKMYNISCSRCDKIINIGETVIRKAKNGRGKSTKHYHKECAKSVNII